MTFGDTGGDTAELGSAACVAHSQSPAQILRITIQNRSAKRKHQTPGVN